MKPEKAFALLGLLALCIMGYRLFVPKCRWCNAALGVIALSQKVVCPHCGKA